LNDLHLHLIEVLEKELAELSNKLVTPEGRMRECRVKHDDYSDFPCPFRQQQ
jgi:hypothetical protein